MNKEPGDASECDSILNLDELLRDENSAPQPQLGPPDTLEGWAGPNIFRGMVVA
jgi:hypothetical protein